MRRWVDLAEDYLRDHETVGILNQTEVDILPRLSILEESGPFKGRGVVVFYPWEDLIILEYRDEKGRQLARVGIPLEEHSREVIESAVHRLFSEVAPKKRQNQKADIIRQIWSFLQKVVCPLSYSHAIKVLPIDGILIQAEGQSLQGARPWRIGLTAVVFALGV